MGPTAREVPTPLVSGIPSATNETKVAMVPGRVTGQVSTWTPLPARRRFRTATWAQSDDRLDALR